MARPLRLTAPRIDATANPESDLLFWLGSESKRQRNPQSAIRNPKSDSGIRRADPQSLFDLLQACFDQLATFGDGSL